MQYVVLAVVGAAIVAVSLLVAAFLGALFGGIAGWGVGWAFPYVIETINNVAGTSLTGFQVGATLGFFGAFFRSSVTNN